MLLRELGLKVLELEDGPYLFLLVDCQPVAYRDKDRWFRASNYIRKGATKAMNKWLRNRPVTMIPQAEIQRAFQGLSRFAPETQSPNRRAEDSLDPRVKQLAQALVEIMGNGAKP